LQLRDDEIASDNCDVSDRGDYYLKHCVGPNRNEAVPSNDVSATGGGEPTNHIGTVQGRSYWRQKALRGGELERAIKVDLIEALLQQD
jgi:hypothetical protein